MFGQNLNYYFSGAVCPSVCLSAHLSVCLSTRLSVCPSVCLSAKTQIRWTDISNSRIQAQRAWRLSEIKRDALFVTVYISGFNEVSFPVKHISWKKKLAQIRIPGHFLSSDLHQQCATKASMFASIGRILLAMKQSFLVKLEQFWKKGRSSVM